MKLILSSCDFDNENSKRRIIENIDKALLKKLYISLKNKCNNDIEQNFIMNLNEKIKCLV